VGAWTHVAQSIIPLSLACTRRYMQARARARTCVCVCVCTCARMNVYVCVGGHTLSGFLVVSDVVPQASCRPFRLAAPPSYCDTVDVCWLQHWTPILDSVVSELINQPQLCGRIAYAPTWATSALIRLHQKRFSLAPFKVHRHSEFSQVQTDTGIQARQGPSLGILC
jgi:hypothetical protein